MLLLTLFRLALNITSTRLILIEGHTGTAAAVAAPSTSTFTYGSDWANIPTDQQMFLMRTMRRYVVGGDGNFELFGKTWNWLRRTAWFSMRLAAARPICAAYSSLPEQMRMR